MVEADESDDGWSIMASFGVAAVDWWLSQNGANKNAVRGLCGQPTGKTIRGPPDFQEFSKG